MATIDDIKNGSNPEDDGTIVDPNLRRRRSLAENAARHGFKETKEGLRLYLCLCSFNSNNVNISRFIRTYYRTFRY